MESALTKQQQELVEQNHNLIYKFAHQNNLSIDDYYDILAIGLCRASKMYNEDKGAFSTIAYVCMKTEVMGHWRKISAKGVIPVEKIVSYNVSPSEESNGNETYLCCIADNNCTCDIAISNVVYERFYDLLTYKEKTIVELLMNSVSQSKIAEEIGCTKQNVAYYVSQLRKKIKNYLNAC